MKKQYFFFLLVSMVVKFVDCQTNTKCNDPGQRAIVSLCDTTEVQYNVDSSGQYYSWEFMITDKQNRISDSFKVNKARLSGLMPQLRRTDFYKNIKVIAILKNTENFVLLVDKFGEVDVHLYPLSGNSPKRIIPFKQYKLTPMNMDMIGEDFQDSKLIGNSVYTLSKDLRGNNALYCISVINLHTGKVQQAAVDIASAGFVKNIYDSFQPILELEDRSFRTTGAGFKFSLLVNDVLVIRKNNKTYRMEQIKFKVYKTYRNKGINAIIE